MSQQQIHCLAPRRNLSKVGLYLGSELRHRVGFFIREDTIAVSKPGIGTNQTLQPS